MNMQKGMHKGTPLRRILSIK
uniref:Uncharacterized protein n=1 Tax=Anguilla anguilla TaxID=7936 RepID=A0A0E9RHY8_ANGAN